MVSPQPWGKWMKTLILCSANVCRSPAAEALWRATAGERRLPSEVASAGLQARPGQQRSAQMLRLLASAGVAAPENGASPFIRTLACRHDLVLVMEPAHQQQVLSLAPELTGRVQLLGRWGQGAITDPTGGSPQDYATCFSHLSAAVDAWLDRLTTRSARTSGMPVAAHA
jgi:protein-tyrosine phosphatase